MQVRNSGSTGNKQPPKPNVRSQGYFVLESRMLCLRCDTVTAVYGLALPAGYESLEALDDDEFDEDDDDTSGQWMEQEVGAALAYVDYLPGAVAQRMQSLSRHYRPDRDEGDVFWMNHCQHCGAVMEEEDVCEPLEGPFGELPYEGSDVPRLYEVREPFEARASTSCEDPEFFRSGIEWEPNRSERK